MTWTTWIGLLLCNLVWAVNPSIAKRIILEIGPQHTAWLKYVVALLTYVTVMGCLRLRSQNKKNKLFMPLKPDKNLLLVILIGFATCFVSPMTQMSGLKASTAVNNSILVTFEPIFTVVFGCLIFRERLKKSHYLSFPLAIMGFLFLSNIFEKSAAGQMRSFAMGYGDLLLLAAVAGEALYSVLARDLIKRYQGPMIFGSAMLVGVILLSSVVLPWKGLPDLAGLSVTGWFAVVWLGVMGTAVPYLYWLHALRKSLSLGSVVLSLFLQPLLGSIAAVVFLGESFGTNQIIGGGMICLGIAFQAFTENRSAVKREALSFP
ncbi:MAG: DMT family transporter [Elusimicrobiales bacterium]|jgi:drug/metabolite transporter (DMT)-like permease